MQFIHDEKIIEKFPNNFTGIIVIKNIDKSRLGDITNLLAEKIKSVINSDDMNKATQNWMDIFVKMGAKAKYKSSLVAARDFWRENNRLYNINPIVDFYNHYSLYSMVPMGAYDLSKISGDLQLTIAAKDLEFIGIGGRDIQKTTNGEIIYKDDEHVLCRCWNLKDCDHTKITEDTDDVLFIFDIIADNTDDAMKIFEKFKSDFTEYFGTLNYTNLTGKGISVSDSN